MDAGGKIIIFKILITKNIDFAFPCGLKRFKNEK